MRKNKGLAVIMAAIMVLTSGFGISYAETSEDAAAGAASDSTFSDIRGHWAEEVIKEAAGLKIVGGYPDGTFLPDNIIKREEFYKLITNILTITPDTSNTKIQFPDVDMAEWYVPTIKTAVAAGIASGYTDGTFGIGQMISRQEAAKVAGSVISVYTGENEEGAETALDKGSIADWAYDYVDLMFKKKYMKGDTEGNFRPTTALTRAEAATILLHIKKNEKVIGSNTDGSALAGCIESHGGEAGVFTVGEGTKAEPYEIHTAEQLNHMRMHTTESAFYILKKNIAVTKDYATESPKDHDEADWSAGNFQPIGNEDTPFEGKLNGNGFTISGLNIIGTEGRGDNKRLADYSGLFGYLAKKSEVKDLIIDASNIEGYQYVGAVAGYTEGTVSDCQLGKKGVVNGRSYIGGISGYSTSPLADLTNRGTVTGEQNTGGIVGCISAPGTVLIDCKNEGSIEGREKTGGIAGSFVSSNDAESIVKDCHNNGTVRGTSYQAGGIAGHVGTGYYKAVIEGCDNSGEVTGTGRNGGIAGWLSSEKASIVQCKNTGTVEGSGAGGIVGNNQGIISDCYNSGTVIADIEGGGIAAYHMKGKGKIIRSYNEGSVLANSYSGGIAGENASAVESCYSSGKVRGSGISGGIIGKNVGTVKNVYSAGIVTGEKSSGSLIGRNSGSLNDAYWLNTSNALSVGLEDYSSNPSVIRVTHEELSGQKKVKTMDGYVMLIDLLNGDKETWKYLYKILIPAPGSKSVISDGGNVVPPLEAQSTDNTGNTIDPADVNSKYLYPVTIN